MQNRQEPASQPILQEGKSHPPAKRGRTFPLLLSLVGIVMLLLAALAASDSTRAAPLQQGTVPPGGTVPTPPAVVLLSLGRSGKLESASDELSYRDEDIVAYRPSTGALDLYFDGSVYGLQALDLRDFEVLADGSFIFTGNKPFTLNNANGTIPPLAVDDSDIVRHHPISDSFSIYLRGADIGLTTGSEDIDALAFAPDGRLLISTIGSARVNGPSGEVVARDEDLLACDVDATPVTCTLYFDGSDVRLTRGSEDLMSAWVDPSGQQPHFFTTKGRYKAEGSRNKVDADREVIFGCLPLSAEESTGLTDCDFFLFLDTEEEFDTEKQIDGLWMGSTISIPTPPTVQAAAADELDPAQEELLDGEEFTAALAEGDDEIDIYDFAATVQEFYLPVIDR